MLLLLSLKPSVYYTWDVTTVMLAPQSHVLPAPLQTYHRSGLKLFLLQFLSVLGAVVPHQSDFIGREILDMCVWDLWFGLECICALYHMCVTCSIYSALIALIKTMLDGRLMALCRVFLSSFASHALSFSLLRPGTRSESSSEGDFYFFFLWYSRHEH